MLNDLNENIIKRVYWPWAKASVGLSNSFSISMIKGAEIKIWRKLGKWYKGKEMWVKNLVVPYWAMRRRGKLVSDFLAIFQNIVCF